MDILRKGLNILKEIEVIVEPKLEPEFLVDKIEEYLKIDEVLEYRALLDSNSHAYINEYYRLLIKLSSELTSVFKKLGITSFSEFYSKEYDIALHGAIGNVKSINRLIEGHEKNIKEGRLNSIVEMGEDALHEGEPIFSESFRLRVYGIAFSAERFMELTEKMKTDSCFKDFINRLEKLTSLVKNKLKDLSEVKDVFVDDVVEFIAYKIFVGEGIIEHIDKDKFIDQLRYRNRNLTLKVRNRKKKYATRAIYMLSKYVMTDYKDEWEQRMVEHFRIKSYERTRNSNTDTIEIQKIDNLINIIDTSLNI